MNTHADIPAAIFSESRSHRYFLFRQLSPGDKHVVFIGLNPSTADETVDDPTIRRCKDFARQWGYNQLVMMNLFAFRATSPDVMKAQGRAAIGIYNDMHLIDATRDAGLVVAAWGKDGKHLGRAGEVMGLLAEHGVNVCHLGMNKDGSPKHPLYLKKTTVPVPWMTKL